MRETKRSRKRTLRRNMQRAEENFIIDKKGITSVKDDQDAIKKNIFEN